MPVLFDGSDRLSGHACSIREFLLSHLVMQETQFADAIADTACQQFDSTDEKIGTRMVPINMTQAPFPRNARCIPAVLQPSRRLDIM